MKPNAQPVSLNVGRFRQSPRAGSTVTGDPPAVYLAIALTKLERSNGCFQWEGEEVTLDAGDGIAWEGNCIRTLGTGEGGIMQLVTYR